MTPDEAIDFVCDSFEQTREHVLSSCIKESASLPRAAVCYIMRHVFEMSIADTAKITGLSIGTVTATVTRVWVRKHSEHPKNKQYVALLDVIEQEIRNSLITTT